MYQKKQQALMNLWFHILEGMFVKTFMTNNSVKFGYKFRVAATQLRYTIQFYLYVRKDKNCDATSVFSGSLASKLAGSLSNQDGSNYRIVICNFFISPPLLRLLKEMGLAVTGSFQINHAEKAPLKTVKGMEKSERVSPHVVTENDSNITFVRWKDNEIVTVVFTFHGGFSNDEDLKVYQRKTW